MGEHKNILLVTNSTTDSEIGLIKEAFLSAKEQGLQIKLNLVHVIPHLPTCYFNIPSMVLLAERYYEEATQTLTAIGQVLDIAKKDQWLITGKIKTEVLRLANKMDTHFILASSTSIQDLHKSFLFVKKGNSATPIRSISSLVTL
ncbi:MAG: hypothetical protein ABI597_04690 [Gammaproteobacteria bacterium]